MTNKLFLFLATASLFAACSKDDNNGTTPPPPANGSDTIDIRGTISANVTWSKDKVYRLRGYVYVNSPATLTIEAGTTVISNKDSAGVLLIYKGAKIMAAGTKEAPIVFTSAEADKLPGDLGGIVLVGNATGNGNHGTLEGNVDADHKAFGGNDDHDNSGVLKYVRIEYAGKATGPNDEINGLSLYAVGDGTALDYIQVIRGLDDGFEFFGGSVNAKHLIAYKCADDDFDFDDGYHGKIQYAISIKDPAFTDDKTKGDLSNNFEVDNTSGAIPFTTTPITHPVLSNFTAIGPNNAANTSPNYGYGMRWRRGAQFEMANSIVIGAQKAGLDLDNDETILYYKAGVSKFENSFLQAVNAPYQLDVLTANPPVWTAADLKAMVEGANMSKLFANPADIQLTDPFNLAAPNVKPQAGSIALTTAGKYTGGLDNVFFDKTTFVGAMDATNDWTATWTRFGN